MKRFNRGIAIVLLLYLVGCILANLVMADLIDSKIEKEYQIEINRLHQNITSEKSAEQTDLSAAVYVEDIAFLSASANARQTQDFFDGAKTAGGANYLVKPVYDMENLIGYARYTYEQAGTRGSQSLFAALNAILGGAFLFALGFLLYIRQEILLPFHEMQEYPVELSKGRLNKGLKENKNRFFGRFIWGLDMLRDSIASQKAKQIALEKERKTLILSISHGIKTPLSAILLYAKGLSENLYDTGEKRQNAAGNIEDNARKIQHLVDEIVNSQTQDLIDIEVVQGEFFLNDLLSTVRSTFSEKLSMLKIEFRVDSCSNILLHGDKQRLMDVFENLLENAIKYGDGREIGISFAKEENFLLISVTNTGDAVPQHEADHVFDSFFRGSNATDKPGNGLGLYICKYLMNKMNGDIYIARDEPGMRFVVVVPMA